MPKFRLACIAPNQTPLDWEGNLERILTALREIRQASPPAPQIILLPELSLSGYSCEDAFFAERSYKLALKQTHSLAKETDRLFPATLLFCGLPFLDGNATYNCMAALLGGRIVGLHAKSHLANEGLHYEARHFRAWNGGPKTVQINSEEIPFGVFVYEFAGLRIGLEICRDSWVADRPMLGAQSLGLDLILNPSASHFAFGKYDLRRRLAVETSRQFSCHFVQVNLLGNEAGRAIFDGSILLAAGGTILSENPGMGFSDFLWQIFSIDSEPLRTARRRSAAARPSIAEQSLQNISPKNAIRLYRLATESARNLGFSESQERQVPKSPPSQSLAEGGGTALRTVRNGKYRKFDEFLRSTTLGLFDYLRKSHAKGFVVSLSGGADSAAVALLIERMIGFGIHLLGAYGFLNRIGRSDLIARLQESLSETEKLKKTGFTGEKLRPLQAAITKELLLTIYQGTAQSSERTRQAAWQLARALNSRHSEAQVENLVREYKKLAEAALQRSLAWKSDDLALQNIQARVRAPLAWLLANATGSLLVSTGNRSEASVGYATMDGDTAGGLAPIAGVSKPFILEFLSFMQEKGDAICGPVPELSAVTSQSPTAELRPPTSAQSDESDLMPYPILEAIEIRAIRDLKSPSQILSDLLQEEPFSTYSEEDLRAWVQKFFGLWTKSQWKRERLAPSFHLDTHSLDPRGYFRFPVLSQGFAEEIE